MGYLPRFDYPGVIHHVWARGVGPGPVYLDLDDRLSFIAIASRAFDKLDVTCLARCEMTTHYHFVLRIPDTDAVLSELLQRINGHYARSFNRRHKRWGHLFGERFGSRFIQTQEDLLGVVRYVFLNPLDDPRCHHPRDWPFSSYANALDELPDPLASTDELLKLVAGAERLRRFVEEYLPSIEQRAA